MNIDEFDHSSLLKEKAELTSKVNQLRLNLALESTGLGMWDHNIKTGEVIRNEQWAKMLGYTLDEIKSNVRDWTGLIHPDDLPRVLEEARKYEAGETPEFKVEHRLKTKSGDWKWILNWGKAVEVDLQGKPVRVIGCHLDISDRKNLEDILEKNHFFLRQIIEANPHEILIRDKNGTIFFAGNNYTRYYGHTPESIIGVNSTELWRRQARSQAQIDRWLAEDQKVIETGEILDYVEELIYKNGPKAVYRTIKKRIITPGGVSCVMVHYEDITMRKQAEDALRQSEDRLYQIVQNMPVMMNAFDENPNIVAWNRECELVTGYIAEEVINNPQALELMYPDIQYREKMINEWRAISNDYRNWEWDLICKDGSLKTISWSNISMNFPISGWKTWEIGIDITERKRVEHDLISQRNRVQQYLDIAGVMLIALDTNQNVILINRRGAEILGFNEAEIIGKNWFDAFVPKAEREKVKSVFNRLVKGNIKPVEYFENAIINKNEEERIIAWHNNVLKDSNGTIIGILSSGEDISERKQAEELLRDSEERFRVLFEQAPLSYQSLDKNANFIEINDTWCKMLGYEKKEVIGKNFSEYIHPDFRQKFKENFARFKKIDFVSGIEYIMLKKDGTEIFISMSGRIARNSDSSFKQTHCIFQDITEQKKIEQALQISEEKYRKLVETMNEGLLIVDENRKFTYVNAHFAEMLGRLPAEIIGHDPSEFFDKANLKILEDQWRKRRKGIYKPYEIEWTRKNGTRVATLVSPKPVLGIRGKFGGSFSIVSDITERKRGEIWNTAKVKLLDKLRITNDIDECLKLSCLAVREARLFKHAICTLTDQNGDIINIKHIGLNKQELAIVKDTLPLFYKRLSQGLEQKYRISNSYFIPHEIGFDLAKLDKMAKLDRFNDSSLLAWETDDRLLVPISGDHISCDGWLLVDMPFNLCIDTSAIAYLEDVAIRIAKRVNEIHFVEELKNERQMLADKNVALREVMAHIEEEKMEIRQKIAARVDQMILPAIKKLVKKDGSINQIYYNFLDKNIKDLSLSSCGSRYPYTRLSPREVEICDLLKSGASSKEIAETLHLSTATIQKHRERIRNKLGLSNKSINLTSYLKNPQ